MVGKAGVAPQRAAGFQIARDAAQQVAIRPDPPDAFDRSAGKGHGKRDGIAVAGGLRPALASAACFAVFLQVGGPDDRASRPDRSVQRGYRLSIARRADRKVVEARTFAARRTDDHLVKAAAKGGAYRAANRAADNHAESAEY